MVTEKPPSLVDLCVQTAIDNVKYIGDVGETDFHLLERILSHCTAEQLMHIENRTEDKDLSPITNKLWKRFYESKFGEDHTKLVVNRLKQVNAPFTWRQLYEAKLKDQDETKKKLVERLTQSYKEENARKQSRQVKVCMKVPPSSNKRSFGGGFGGGYSFSNTKSNIMKKAKVEYLNSQEIKNRVAMKKTVIQRHHTNVPSSSKTQNLQKRSFSGSSRFTR